MNDQEFQDLEVKQQYLREEIILKGYDADDFTLWIDKNKAKGRFIVIKGVNLTCGTWMSLKMLS